MKLVFVLALICLISFELAYLPQASKPCRRNRARRESGSESEESDENDDCDRRTLISRANRRRNSRTFLGNRRKSSSASTERSLFSIINTYRREPWWTGPNVCKRNEVFKSWKTATSVNVYGESCREGASSFRCSSTNVENGTAVKNVTVYECCLGFRRKYYGQRGCPEERKLNNTEDTLQQLNLTRFLDAAKKAGLFDKMSPENNYTIFAPSNEAFDDSSTNPDDISFVTLETQDKMKFVRDILASHVVPQLASAESFDDNDKRSTLKKDAVIMMSMKDTLFSWLITANCARVTKVDYQTKNAYIHVIDRLMPEATKSLLQLLNEDARFSTFVSLLDADSRKLLDDPDNYLTVLAFTDDSVEKLPQTVRQKIKSKQSCMSDLVENHITRSAICTASLIYGEKSFASLNSDRLFFNVSSSGASSKAPPIISVNGRRLIGKDKVAVNGVLHVVDGPIFFSSNNDPLDVVTDLGYREFAEALKISPITEFLAAHNDTIIYVPPQWDIEKILASNDTAQKTKFLLNHVARISDFKPSTVVETLAGQRFDVRHTLSTLSEVLFGEPRQYSIGCARSYQYKAACDSIVQQINKPLPLSSSSIMEILRNDSQLSDFTFLVEASGLDKTFFTESNDSFTVFAPDNRAMKKYVRPEQNDYLLQNQDSLKRFVQRHVVRGSLCCNQFGGRGFFGVGLRAVDGFTLRTSGSENDRDLKISYADLLTCDRQAVNGIVHVVDMPLARVVSARRRPSQRWASSSMSREDLVDAFDNLFNIDF